MAVAMPGRSWKRRRSYGSSERAHKRQAVVPVSFATFAQNFLQGKLSSLIETRALNLVASLAHYVVHQVKSKTDVDTALLALQACDHTVMNTVTAPTTIQGVLQELLTVAMRSKHLSAWKTFSQHVRPETWRSLDLRWRAVRSEWTTHFLRHQTLLRFRTQKRSILDAWVCQLGGDDLIRLGRALPSGLGLGPYVQVPGGTLQVWWQGVLPHTAQCIISREKVFAPASPSGQEKRAWSRYGWRCEVQSDDAHHYLCANYSLPLDNWYNPGDRPQVTFTYQVVRESRQMRGVVDVGGLHRCVENFRLVRSVVSNPRSEWWLPNDLWKCVKKFLFQCVC